VADIETLVVRNEAEALLTESHLIKQYRPRFNIVLRDDKRYLALRADPRDPVPRLATCRLLRDDGALYFGPFPSAAVVRAALDFTEKRSGCANARRSDRTPKPISTASTTSCGSVPRPASAASRPPSTANASRRPAPFSEANVSA
jgi:excinuclease UvrABC nuclease subunit